MPPTFGQKPAARPAPAAPVRPAAPTPRQPPFAAKPPVRPPVPAQRQAPVPAKPVSRPPAAPARAAVPPKQAPVARKPPAPQVIDPRALLRKITECVGQLESLITDDAGEAGQEEATEEEVEEEAQPAPAKRGPGRPPGSTNKPAPVPVQKGPPAEGDDDLSTLNRKQLAELCAQYGIESQGLKAEDLRTAIREAREGGAEPAAEEGTTGDFQLDETSQLKAEGLMTLIEDNYEQFAPYIDPNADESVEGALRCGGDCQRCPAPEAEYGGDPNQQIAACYASMHESLGLTPDIE